MSPLQPRSEKYKNTSSEPRVPQRHGRSVVLFGLIGLVDLALFVLVLQQERVEWLIIRMPLMLSVAYFAQPYSDIRPWSSRQGMLSLTAILLPGVGSLIAASWSLQTSKAQGAWQDVPAALKPSRTALDVVSVLDVMPLIDVLESGDTARKKSTLLKLQTMRTAMQAPVVRKALDDQDPEVRYYAASLLSHAEAVHSTEINRLEQELRDEPEDVQLWNALAAQYQALLAEGISGEELSRFYQEKRLVALNRSLALDAGQPEIGIAKAEALLALGNTDAAEKEAHLWLWGQVEAAISDQARGVLLKVAYQRNDQETLAAILPMIETVTHVSADVRGLVQLWQQEQERRAAR